MVSHKAKLAAAALATTLAATSVSASEVNLYSARHYDSDQAIYNAFTEETGIKVNYDVFDSNEVLETKMLVEHILKLI